MAFEPINTEEEFEKAIKERVETEKTAVRDEYKDFLSPEAVEKKYKGYMSPERVQEKYKDYLPPEEAAKKDTLIKGYELEKRQVKAARSAGLPIELAGRLSGETEEDMKKDAEMMAQYLKGNPSPEYTPEPTQTKDSGTRAAVKKMLSELKED